MPLNRFTRPETAMKPSIVPKALLICTLNAGALLLPAQTPAASTDTTPPSYDMKAQALLDL